jgi:hypothetical protein
MSETQPRTESRKLTPAEWLIIALGSALLFTTTVNAKPLQSANDRSRWCTVWALVERNTFQIDEIDAKPGWGTIDKVRYKDHFYSTKPPLLSVAVAGVYKGLKSTFGLDMLKQTDLTCQSILLIVNWLPMTIAYVLLARILRKSTENLTARLLANATFCFGTLVPSYATTLNNHSVATVFLVLCLAPTIRILSGSGVIKRNFIFAGFWAALVPCHELPGALFGAALFVMLARKDFSLTAKYFVPAALVPLAAYFATIYLCSGSWKPFYLSYGTELYEYEFEGIKSYWMSPRGMDQSLDSPVAYCFHCVFGHHGIFSLSPVFLLIGVSLATKSRWKDSQVASVIWLGLGLSVAVLGFYLTRTSNYNYGGNTFGLRWMIWLSPFWVLALVPAFEAISDKKSGLAIAFVLLGVSVFSSVSAARNPWTASWLFHQMSDRGWIDYSDPKPDFPFKRKLYTWFAELPDGEPGAFVEFTSTGNTVRLSDRRPETIRLVNLGRLAEGEQTLQKIRFEFNTGRSDASVLAVSIDVTAFNAGRKLNESVASFESDSDLPLSEVISILRGVPVERPYNPGVTRHVRTKLRRNAFRCQRAATQVEQARISDQRRIRYRSDLWLTPEIPFGTIQFDLTETDVATGEQFSKTRFIVTDFSEPASGSVENNRE